MNWPVWLDRELRHAQAPGYSRVGACLVGDFQDLRVYDRPATRGGPSDRLATTCQAHLLSAST